MTTVREVRGWLKAVGLPRCQVVVEGDEVRLHRSGTPDHTTCLFFVRVTRHVADDGSEEAVLNFTAWASPFAYHEMRMREWDPDALQAAMLACLMVHVFKPKAAFANEWLEERIQGLTRHHAVVSIMARPPKALRDVQIAIGTKFGEVMDHGFKAAVSSVKACFEKYQNRLSRDEVMEWFDLAACKNILEA